MGLDSEKRHPLHIPCFRQLVTRSASTGSSLRDFAWNAPLYSWGRSTIQPPECIARRMCVSQFGGASAVSPNVIVKRRYPVQKALQQGQPR